jgi:hypothetical protein
MTTYVIAPRVGSSTTIPSDWIERIRRTPGVAEVRVGLVPDLLRVSASEAGIGVIRQRFGAQLIIEPAAAYSLPQ